MGNITLICKEEMSIPDNLFQNILRLISLLLRYFEGELATSASMIKAGLRLTKGVCA